MTHYFMTDGMTDLDVLVADDVDLDGTFDAIDIDTGDTIRINGWLIEAIEPVQDDAL